MAKDRRDDSAETATWWPEFVRVYGTVSLRELARRFEPPAEVVVVRKGARAQVMETHEPAPLAAAVAS